MIIRDIKQTILFEPLRTDVNELFIVSGYATPNMLSWYIKNLEGKTRTPIKIHLLIGMIPYDGISVSAHEGFIQLIHDDKPEEVDHLECSYLFDMPAVNSNIYIWAKDGNPVLAFAGSAHFVQNAFVGARRQEIMLPCAVDEATREYESLIGRSIYINPNYSRISLTRIIHGYPELRMKMDM